MDNIFESDATLLLRKKVDRDFVMSFFKAVDGTSGVIDVNKLMKLDEAVAMDKDKKPDHLKSVFTDLGI